MIKIPRSKNWYFVVVAAISGLLILMISFTFDIFQYGDNCGYLSLGFACANGKGFTDPALSGSFHFLWWPPGFPLFIALFVKIFGTHWYMLKILIFLGLYVSFTLYAILLYREEQNLIKAVLILTALCFSSGIHLLSSYLYAETFFLVCTLLFFFLWHIWHEKLTLARAVILSLFALYISMIRLTGICLPAALAIILLFFEKPDSGRRWYCIIPVLLVVAYIFLALYYPPLRVGSLRAAIGLDPRFGSVITGAHAGETIDTMRLFGHYGGKTIRFLRGYGLTIIPQAVIRSIYDSYAMNRLKALVMALVSCIIILGWVTCLKKYALMNFYVLIYMGVLFVYGPLYVRLVVPIIPFLFLYLYNGLENLVNFFIKSRRTALIVLATIWVMIIFDNALRSLTDPHRTMLPRFGDEQFQDCIAWTVENIQPNEIVVCQIHSYLFLKRGPYCLPYNYAKTVNEFMTYLDEHTVRFIIISPFYHRSHDTYMERTREAEKLYPQNFKKIFGKKGDASYILEYIPNPTI